ncbi:valine--tRNA ligase [Sulfobacillus harzensis]|uniref:Valine--tRNA ligase n=1 Tax=Sulfobacillus harzensis TaxID=2729629 RepID=A0A7Y0L100_9FIRM|nr:valine--tRNA ligase [Sulfobacillus harzensis]NMP21250.1 valine--tRNA ligase [Sulfobacillus harzensis]
MATTNQDLSPRYDPGATEDKWYQRWREGGFFRPSMEEGRPVFTIVMPPPNVTGVLHLGHALNSTWQDILVRYHRMRQDNTLWLPGTDHAGIHTQMKVDELLRSQGRDRRVMGREAFIEEVWRWKEQYGGRILEQVAKLGASVDWSRLRFTFDEGLSRAVTEVFVRLYEEGLMYRGNYITNWCVSCQTALSDIEVDHVEQPGTLTQIAYPLTSGAGEIVVATTRPETMLGDTAVAVHPDDERYQHLIGQTVMLPLVKRPIPIIADHYVDREYGTGALKVTPAHDPNDFQMGKRHNLAEIKVIGEDGRMTEAAGSFQGMTREEARQAVLQALADEGAIRGQENITHAVGHCEKCDSIIEPLLSLQWFIKIRPLAEPAMEAVKRGEIRFVPERFEKVYMNWMENLHDWCVSRQIWWGHRIPAYYCESCGEMVVSREPVEICPECGGSMVQDEDVLDTWFSSALWPFSTLGWPEETEDLKTFYPTSVLSTGYDILPFWVSRMIMQGIHFTGQKPFSVVLLHGLVRDAQGRKMSKSLGNGVDPLDVIEKYGADALRMALVLGAAPGNDYRWSWDRFEAASHFGNKVYNAVRFVLMNREAGFKPDEAISDHPADQWIWQRLNQTIETITAALEDFEFGQAARAIYDFFWDDYCDWYIEMAKVRLKGSDKDRRRALSTLMMVAIRALKLLHPIMPFVTEELYQALGGETESIMIAPWPEPNPERSDWDGAAAVETIQELIRAGRNLRAEMGLTPRQKASFIAIADDDETVRRWEQLRPEAALLLRAESLAWGPRETLKKPERAVAGVTLGGTIYMPLEGLIDIERERERVAKAMAEAEKERARVEARLADPNFVARAPQEVVQRTQESLAELQGRIKRLEERQEVLR